VVQTFRSAIAGRLEGLRPTEAIPSESIAPGITRQMMWGERVMVCRLTFDPGVVTAVHSHPHEQIVLVERGRVRFSVDGRDYLASAGDIVHFRSGCLHGATILDEPTVLIDIFSPVREDFLPGPSR
jgi:quercetin dioxygenase-like cupin family protein